METNTIQYRIRGSKQWHNLPELPTADDYTPEFAKAFLINYHSNEDVIREANITRDFRDEITKEQFEALGYGIPTIWQAGDERLRLSQRIINKATADFFSDLSCGRIEIRSTENEHTQATFTEQLNQLQQRVIGILYSINDRPEGWLPHLVFVEEEGEDNTGAGAPVYNQYQLMDYSNDGSCSLRNPITHEIEERDLSEINTEWLITLINWYSELSGKSIKSITPSKDLYVFTYSIGRFERNACDEEIIKSFDEGDGSELDTKRYTPDEFAALVNDEVFCDTLHWVRFIKM